MQFIWIFVAFIAGALPLSLWIGFAAGHDIRLVGDGNPGATNVFKAAGTGWGLFALSADFTKAAIPVGLAYQIFGWQDTPLIVLIALAPSLGHAFSPFLNWHGGKALATIGGAWIGLTLYTVPLLLMFSLTSLHFLVKPDSWAAIFSMVIAFIYLLIFDPNPYFLAVVVLQIGLIMWTHRSEVLTVPIFKPLSSS
ncbi:MAG: glycerol-3-phosphate acyltransferase [Chloroflexota bacterium]